MSTNQPKIGISACLLGHAVRFNGDGKRHDWVVEELARTAELLPVCPELAMGLSTPRPAMRLMRSAEGSVRLVTSNTGEDLTELASKTVSRLLAAPPLWDGFILKKDSPSCGLERVKVYGGPQGFNVRDGQGVFASRLRETHPWLPIIEEGRLSDPEQREHFVMRVFAYYRVRALAPVTRDIQNFHRVYKLILMEHSPSHYQRLGRIVGNAEKLPAEVVLERYVPLFMEALSVPSSIGKRANVLQHMIGYLHDRVDGRERQELVGVIEEYRQGLLPLMAPLSLIRYLVKKFSLDYLEGQLFFEPYPKTLALRSPL